MLTRRSFLKSAVAAGAAGIATRPLVMGDHHHKKTPPWFDISLAQWSLHQAFRAGDLDAMDFAAIAHNDFGIHAIEYVNQFYMDDLSDKLVAELKKRANSEGVKSVLIMCDRLGQVGDPSKAARKKTVENHKPWAEAAKALGCHSIRVNAGSEGSYEEQIKLAADGLSQLAEMGDSLGINILVENHGGLSSNGEWLAAVMKKVDSPRCGTLPDFGNFTINRETGESFDRYHGAELLMPYAKGVSAKSYDFDEDGSETTIDYSRMLDIVKDAGYRGYIGIEYEGKETSEPEGIKLTKALLERLGGR